MVTVVEPNWITNLLQAVAGLTVFVGLWLGWKQYKYQRMESVEKADKQIQQNEKMIELLTNIDKKIK